MTKYESMQIVKIPKNRINYTTLSQAVRLLKQGGVLVYPTETAYGLGCDFTNKKAREKIYKIKGRRAGKKLPVIAGDMRMARRYAVFDAVSERLAERYWPGPLTLVLPAFSVQRLAFREAVGDELQKNIPRRGSFWTALAPSSGRGESIRTRSGQKKAGKQQSKIDVETQNIASSGNIASGNIAYMRDKKNTIALRVSSHKIARLLSKKLGRPIVSTSANISGRGNCYSVEEITEQFKGRKHQPDLILDYGRLPEAPSSTVARVAGGEVKMLRRGGIKIS